MDFKTEAKKIRNEMIAKYFYKEGKPSLANSIIAFIDILGFKNLIAEGSSQENLQKIYMSYLKHFEEIKNSTAIIKTFSDNMIVVYPEIEEGNLGSAFINLANFQSELLKYGIVVRGAITIGQIHVGKDIIFGKGLVEAYQLENEKAVVPRIILSEKVIQLCSKYRAYYADDSGPYARVLLEDADGHTFLNYLYNPYVDGSDFKKVVKDYLKIHRKIIEEKLESHASNIRVFEKYVWLGNYHNNFCDLHSFDLKISSESLTRKMKRIK